MTSTSEPWALYIRPGGRYIVKRYDPERTGLWATLGPLYDRDKAQKLADVLTLDDRSNREETKKRAFATRYAATHRAFAEAVDAEAARSAREQDRGTGSTEAD